MNINYIDDNLIQIFGKINGFAWRVEFKGRKVWRYSIVFFQGGKKIKISTSEREGTLNNVEVLKKNILKKVTENEYINSRDISKEEIKTKLKNAII